MNSNRIDISQITQFGTSNRLHVGFMHNAMFTERMYVGEVDGTGLTHAAIYHNGSSETRCYLYSSTTDMHRVPDDYVVTCLRCWFFLIQYP